VRIAVVDSGVAGGHPHVGAVAGGVAVRPDGSVVPDVMDRIGHGTAVAAAIREKVPNAELYAVKVFDRTLSSDVAILVRGIEWAVGAGCQLINLSLGTIETQHEPRLREVVAWAAEQGSVIVAAGADDGRRWLPGSLPGVLEVRADWDCPRTTFRVERSARGGVICRASGYPREIPGIPPERNLKGVSFAVANMTGFAGRVVEPRGRVSLDDQARLLASSADVAVPGLLGFSATC
jgi:subtilisin family serine protease